MARKIVITSGKGGVGKTTICANLGQRLASNGFRVVLVDADIGLNNLDVVMNVESKVVFDVVDVVTARCRVKQALIQDKRQPTLYILPACQSYDRCNLSKEHIKSVIDMLDSSFDYILIDCPAGVDIGFQRAVFPASEAIVVVTPHISSIRDADKVLSILSNYNLSNKSIVINRVRGDMLLNSEIISVEKIVELLKCQILGVIPEDDDITAFSSIGAMPINIKSARAFQLLAENLHNGTRKVYDCTMDYKGFLGGIKRTIKRHI